MIYSVYFCSPGCVTYLWSIVSSWAFPSVHFKIRTWNLCMTVAIVLGVFWIRRSTEQFIVTFKHPDLFWNEENIPCFSELIFYLFWCPCFLFRAFQVQIQNKKIDLSHVTSKCGSLDNIHHRPGNRKQSPCWFAVSSVWFLHRRRRYYQRNVLLPVTLFDFACV